MVDTARCGIWHCVSAAKRRTPFGHLPTSEAGCLACVYDLPSVRQHAPLPAITSCLPLVNLFPPEVPGSFDTAPKFPVVFKKTLYMRNKSLFGF